MISCTDSWSLEVDACWRRRSVSALRWRFLRPMAVTLRGRWDSFYGARGVVVVVVGTADVVVVGRAGTVVVARAVVGTGAVWRGLVGGTVDDVLVGNGV